MDLGCVTLPDRAEAREALLALMRLPDPPELRDKVTGRSLRRYRYRCGGIDWKQAALRRDLPRVYMERVLLEARSDNGSIVSVRRQRRAR